MRTRRKRTTTGTMRTGEPITTGSTSPQIRLPSSCSLCPRACGADRASGMRGYCGADNKMYAARAALHFWEEPPISGTDGSGTVFFAGCPLKCIYCQNASIATIPGKVYHESCRDSSGSGIKSLNTGDLALTMKSLQDLGALNINLVTGTPYVLQIRSAIDIARAGGMDLPIVWNTSSYESEECITALSGYADVYLADYKYFDGKLARMYSHAPDYPEVALAAIDAMLEDAGEPEFDIYHGQNRMTRGVIIRHLLLPGHLEDSKKALSLLWERYGDHAILSIMNQYTPIICNDPENRSLLESYPNLGQTIADSDYEELLDFADNLGIEDYFWQDGPACSESFIPEFDGFGLRFCSSE
ncbi:MAG: radical SAM protein [Eggerthellaceae bacterium]|nr:radical SAM protein [Eggerthellaceae bacterium]